MRLTSSQLRNGLIFFFPKAVNSCKTPSVNENTKVTLRDSVQLHAVTTRHRHNTKPEESWQLFSAEWKLIWCHGN